MSSTEVAKTEVNIAGGLLWPGLPCHPVLEFFIDHCQVPYERCCGINELFEA
jgi:hypothetical protein